MLDINLMKQIGTVKKFAEDEYIFTEGEKGEDMYIILSGKVEVFIRNLDGFPIKLTEFGNGAFFGEMAILEELPRSATIIATCDTLTLAINKTNFINFIGKQPQLAYNLMKGLSSRIRNMNEELKKVKEGNRETESMPGGVKPTAPAPSAAAKAQETKELINLIYPEGHKNYGKEIPNIYANFLFDKEIKCMCCGNNFDVKMQKISKLRLSKVENDFRQKYLDFEPLYYTIWVCPHCFYANFHYDFEKLPETSIKKVLDGNKEIKYKINLSSSVPRNVNDVFTAYYIALYCTKFYRADFFKLARIWLQLSWLYKDVEDNEMFDYATGQALDNYNEAFFKNTAGLTPEQEQQCTIVIAELLYRKGRVKEALERYHAAAIMKNGSNIYKNHAQDRLAVVKEEYSKTQR